MQRGKWVYLPFLAREKSLILTGEAEEEVDREVQEESLEDERKIPEKLRRRGDLGGDSWCKG